MFSGGEVPGNNIEELDVAPNGDIWVRSRFEKGTDTIIAYHNGNVWTIFEVQVIIDYR